MNPEMMMRMGQMGLQSLAQQGQQGGQPMPAGMAPSPYFVQPPQGGTGMPAGQFQGMMGGLEQMQAGGQQPQQQANPWAQDTPGAPMSPGRTVQDPRMGPDMQGQGQQDPLAILDQIIARRYGYGG